MIVSFGDKTTEDVFHGHDTKAARRIAQALWGRIQVKLDLLNASTKLEDLRAPPSNRLEKLRGNWIGILQHPSERPVSCGIPFHERECDRRKMH